MKRFTLIVVAVPVFGALALAAVGIARFDREQPEPDLQARVSQLELELREAGQQTVELRARIQELEGSPAKEPAPQTSAPVSSDAGRDTEASDTSQAEPPPAKKKVDASRRQKNSRGYSSSYPRNAEEARKLVPDLLASEQSWQKQRALQFIQQHSLTDYLASVTDIVTSEPNGRLGQQAATVLGNLADPRALPALREAYRNGDLGFKRASAVAMKQLGAPGYVQDFIRTANAQMLNNPDGALRHKAAREMAWLRDPSTVPLLSQALNDRNSYVRAEAARALGQIGDRSSLPALAAAKQDPVESVRTAAESASERIENPSSKAGRTKKEAALQWRKESSSGSEGTRVGSVIKNADD